MKNVLRKWWFWAIVIVVLASIGGASGKENAPVVAEPPMVTVAVTTPTVAPQKVGINEETFKPAVAKFFKDINAKKTGIGKLTAKVEVSGATAIVKVTFADLDTWTMSNDIERKEFINILGKSMDTIAANNVYSSNDMVGVNTKLYSPSGLELGERTVFGKVKLK